VGEAWIGGCSGICCSFRSVISSMEPAAPKQRVRRG
jgi:hypothetical protein